MAIAVIPEDEVGERPRPVWWAYTPALLVLGLLFYVVPYGFIEMNAIHFGLVEEFEDVPGFELVQSEVSWYPLESGGSVTLRPLNGGGLAELTAHASRLGYGNGGFVAGGNWTGRSRTDGYDSDMFQSVDNGDGTVTANMAVFDTDLIIAWPFMLTVGAIAFSTAMALGRAIEGFALGRRLAPSPPPS